MSMPPSSKDVGTARFIVMGKNFPCRACSSPEGRQLADVFKADSAWTRSLGEVARGPIGLAELLRLDFKFGGWACARPATASGGRPGGDQG
mmetsp:Transcript_123530/g.394603  ORF Transcript_123530/g.394603 Transcript_123530/m.394603 type:complete len:91 (+) Transcript_123530:1122-1394(+)